MGNVKKAFDDATEALKKFADCFKYNEDMSYSKGGLIKYNSVDLKRGAIMKEEMYMDEVTEKFMMDKLEATARSGNVDEYRRLRKLQKEQKVKAVYGGIVDTAFLPGPDGKILKVSHCSVDNYNAQFDYLEHFSARGGLRATEKFITNSKCEFTLTSYGKVELIDKIEKMSITDYSIIELLDEVEKRTKIEELLSS